MASKITNNSNGPRNIHTSTGVVTLQVGETLGDDYEVSDADLKAMKAVGLLDPADASSKQAGNNSIADIQREIASSATPAVLTDGAAAEDGLVAEDDGEALALKDSGTADDLRKIAKDEGVDLEGDDNKLDIARKIVTARRGV
jgi:hypothetical protein